MANKHENMFHLIIIKGMEFKTTIWYHFKLSDWQKFWKLMRSSVDEDTEQRDHYSIGYGGINWYHHFEKQALPNGVDHVQTLLSSNSIPWYTYPREKHAHVYQKTHEVSQKHYIHNSKGKQLKCLEEWISKYGDIHAVKYNIAVKNEWNRRKQWILI